MKLAFEEELRGFFDDTRKRDEAYPEPRQDKPQLSPSCHLQRIDSWSRREDSRDDLGVVLGGLEGDVIVDVNATTRKGIRSNESVATFSRIKGGDMEVFLPRCGEFLIGLIERVLKIDAHSSFHEIHAPFIECIVDFEDHCL